MNDQRLLLDGRCLEDHNTLEEAKVKHKTILVLERPCADIGIEKAEKKKYESYKNKRSGNKR